MKNNTSRAIVGDHIIAVNVTNGEAEQFEVQEIKDGIYSCKSLKWKTNTIWRFKDTCNYTITWSSRDWNLTQVKETNESHDLEDLLAPSIEDLLAPNITREQLTNLCPADKLLRASLGLDLEHKGYQKHLKIQTPE